MHRTHVLIEERDELRALAEAAWEQLSQHHIRPDSNPVCYVCQSPATCFGRYEGHGPVQWGCDTHCGHGCEDGWCEPAVDAALAGGKS